MLPTPENAIRARVSRCSGERNVEENRKQVTRMTTNSKRVAIVGLLYECPFGADHEGCPLSQRRNEFTFHENLRWTSKLDENTIEDLTVFHQCCLQNREGNTDFYERVLIS